MKKLAAQPNGTLLAHSWGVTNDEPTVIRDVLYVPEKFPGRKVQILDSLEVASPAEFLCRMIRGPEHGWV
ncbi:hypothetical protein DSBG_1383 [Desulfosporosinus sp. BG]|nr:hypothetical protein DSBG_1383 [Desulfosporosinus sp. BG]